MRNIELLEQTMRHIKDYPEAHDQSHWMCGTTACFAGWAAVLAGWSMEKIQDNIGRRAGAELLGLTYDEAGTLFSALNNVEMLELMVKDLVNGDALREPDEYLAEICEHAES